jgi:hypothetical protein
VQEFQIRSIQPRKNVFETNIVVIHDQIPQISLPNLPLPPSRRHHGNSFSRRHHNQSAFYATLLSFDALKGL